MTDSQNLQANPLIGQTEGDTIDNLYKFVEYLCRSSDDDETHPGLSLSLRAVLGAVGSLRQPTIDTL